MAGLSTPLGLLGLLSLVPLIVLYLLQPDPRRISVPTLEFLPSVDEEGGRHPVLEKLQRNLLLLIQIAALVLLAVALGSPFIEVSQTQAADETVIVLDATASMSVEEGGETRFDRAVERAQDEVTGLTSVVVVGSTTTVPVEVGSGSEASDALGALSPTDATGSLASGITRGTAVAEDARIVVISDFSDESDWQGAVDDASAQGHGIELYQYDEGGDDNVGIVDLSFSGDFVTVDVANFGDEEAEREVSLGGASDTFLIESNGLESVTFEMPDGGGEVELSPSDSFSTDDTAYVAAHDDELDVLVVTNDEYRFLTAVLDSMGGVNYEVQNPPISDFDGTAYDIVVFSNVAPDRLLDRTARNAADTVNAGGGVVVQAQEDLAELQDAYGDLLIVDAGGVSAGEGARIVSEHSMVQNIRIPPPREYVEAELNDGRIFVEAGTGEPLVASANVGNGRAMYYGFMNGASDFPTSFEYPVFWRDALHHVADRERASSLNRRTGESLSFADEREVETPSGSVTGTSVLMDETGFYEASNTYSANLLDADESDVTATPVEETEAAETAERTQEQQVPIDMTPHAAFAVLLLVASELGVMRYRGDL